MLIFDHESLAFHYRDEGKGLPLVFQHGLGGDLSQPFAVYRPSPSVRQLGFDFRAHGQTHPLGDENRLSIATLADDLIAFLDHRGIDRAVVGGISLGSAVAVNVALRYPDRVLGLILSRPAWVDGPLPENVRLFSMMARLIRDLGAKDGFEQFRKTPEFQAMARESPDCSLSLVSHFEQPRAEECVARLERLGGDRPCRHRDAYRTIRVPTLILGNHQDPIHPWAFADVLSQLIPGAVLREITPKSVSLERHAADVRQAVDDFLMNHFREKVTPC